MIKSHVQYWLSVLWHTVITKDSMGRTHKGKIRSTIWPSYQKAVLIMNVTMISPNLRANVAGLIILLCRTENLFGSPAFAAHRTETKHTSGRGTMTTVITGRDAAQRSASTAYVKAHVAFWEIALCHLSQPTSLTHWFLVLFYNTENPIEFLTWVDTGAQLCCAVD